MSTIHSSPIHFIPPAAVASAAGQLLTSVDNLGHTAWQNPTTPVLPPNGIQIFFSKQIGSDVNGDGSYTNPYASINFAYAAAGTPTVPVFITGLDAEVYDEQLVLDSSLKFIIGTYANLNWTGAGDAITVLVSGAEFPVIFSTVAAASGNALVNPSNEVVIFQVGSLQQGNVVNSGGGIIIVQSLITTVDFINSGSGHFFYDVTTRLAGTDTGVVQGLCAQSASGPFSIGGYAYPFGGSTTPGYVMTATGPNTLGFAPPLTGFTSINVQTFTSNGTYTPTTGMSYCIVECVGGGGGGGGAASAAGSSAGSGGGGGGAYAKSVIDAATIGASQAVTVGAGGAGGVAGNNNGTNGGTTSLGSLVIADGGGAGFGAAASVTTPALGIYGAGGGGGTGQLVKNGDSGLLGVGWGVSLIGIGGQGGNSFYGIGGEQLVNLPGANGFNYGSGGGGAGSGNTGAVAGGNGQSGIVIITEYIV
jgi:hypothetical protein